MAKFREIPKPGLLGTLHLSHNSYVTVAYTGETQKGHAFQITLINVSNRDSETAYLYDIDFYKGIVKAYGSAITLLAEAYEDEKVSHIPSGGWDHD